MTCVPSKNWHLNFENSCGMSAKWHMAPELGVKVFILHVSKFTSAILKMFHLTPVHIDTSHAVKHYSSHTSILTCVALYKRSLNTCSNEQVSSCTTFVVKRVSLYRMSFDDCQTVQNVLWNVKNRITFLRNRTHCKIFSVNRVKIDPCVTVQNVMWHLSHITQQFFAGDTWPVMKKFFSHVAK